MRTSTSLLCFCFFFGTLQLLGQHYTLEPTSGPGGIGITITVTNPEAFAKSGGITFEQMKTYRLGPRGQQQGFLFYVEGAYIPGSGVPAPSAYARLSDNITNETTGQFTLTGILPRTFRKDDAPIVGEYSPEVTLGLFRFPLGDFIFTRLTVSRVLPSGGAKKGCEIRILGSGYNVAKENLHVFFGGTTESHKAVASEKVSANSFKVTVPAGAQTGQLKVVINSGDPNNLPSVVAAENYTISEGECDATDSSGNGNGNGGTSNNAPTYEWAPSPFSHIHMDHNVGNVQSPSDGSSRGRLYGVLYKAADEPSDFPTGQQVKDWSGCIDRPDVVYRGFRAVFDGKDYPTQRPDGLYNVAPNTRYVFFTTSEALKNANGFSTVQRAEVETTGDDPVAYVSFTIGPGDVRARAYRVQFRVSQSCDLLCTTFKNSDKKASLGHIFYKRDQDNALTDIGRHRVTPHKDIVRNDDAFVTFFDVGDVRRGEAYTRIFYNREPNARYRLFCYTRQRLPEGAQANQFGIDSEYDLYSYSEIQASPWIETPADTHPPVISGARVRIDNSGRISTSFTSHEPLVFIASVVRPTSAGVPTQEQMLNPPDGWIKEKKILNANEDQAWRFKGRIGKSDVQSIGFARRDELTDGVDYTGYLITKDFSDNYSIIFSMPLRAGAIIQNEPPLFGRLLPSIKPLPAAFPKGYGFVNDGRNTLGACLCNKPDEVASPALTALTGSCATTSKISVASGTAVVWRLLLNPTITQLPSGREVYASQVGANQTFAGKAHEVVKAGTLCGTKKLKLANLRPNTRYWLYLVPKKGNNFARNVAYLPFTTEAASSTGECGGDEGQDSGCGDSSDNSDCGSRSGNGGGGGGGSGNGNGGNGNNGNGGNGGGGNGGTGGGGGGNGGTGGGDNGGNNEFDPVWATEKAQPKALYPNPATDSVYVPWPEGTEVQVYLVSGERRIVLQVREGKLDLSDLSTGTYIIRLPEGSVLRVVRQHR